MLKRTDENFAGAHEPLLGKALLDQLRKGLGGRVNTTKRHASMFRRMLSCTTCRCSLNGQQQKGHVYYHYHTRQRRLPPVREESVETEVSNLRQLLCFSQKEIHRGAPQRDHLPVLQ
jgi:hypothetical protein